MRSEWIFGAMDELVEGVLYVDGYLQNNQFI